MNDLEQKNTTIKPAQIFEIVFRYRLLILIPLCISLTCGLIFTFTASKTYQASTTILIQPQKVPTEYVQSIVSSDLDRRLNTISQQILSRSNLEKIIDQFGLYENAEDMYLEDKIASMRKRVSVQIDNSARGMRNTSADVFYVSFTGQNPERVMRIANTLASYFMDENLKVREAQAVGTSEFLESELQKLEQVLEAKEKILSEYRSKHLGGLPDELESNLRTLDRLQLQLSDKQNSLIELKNVLNVTETQISRAEQTKADLMIEKEQMLESEEYLSETDREYKILKDELDDLLSKYTQKHPEVKKAQKKIAILEEKIKSQDDTEQQSSQVGNSKDLQALIQLENKVRQTDNFIFQQSLQISALKNDIRKHERDIESIKTAMLNYQKKVQETPQREQEIQSLQRDYANMRANYNSLLARKLESEIAVNMEKKQKGEQFQILDHARLPEKPISPDVRKLFLLSLIIGLGLGAGLAVLIEFLDSTVKNDEQLETEFGLPLLATIPSMQRKDSNIKKISSIAVISILTIYALSTLSAFVVLHQLGIDRTVGMIRMKLNI